MKLAPGLHIGSVRIVVRQPFRERRIWSDPSSPFVPSTTPSAEQYLRLRLWPGWKDSLPNEYHLDVGNIGSRWSCSDQRIHLVEAFVGVIVCQCFESLGSGSIRVGRCAVD